MVVLPFPSSSRAAWQDGPIHPPRRPVRGARCLMCGVAGWIYPPATPLSYVRVSVDKTYDTLAFYTPAKIRANREREGCL